MKYITEILNFSSFTHSKVAWTSKFVSEAKKKSDDTYGLAIAIYASKINFLRRNSSNKFNRSVS